VTGAAIDSGHYLAEETPQAVVDQLLAFFSLSPSSFTMGRESG